MSSNIRELTKLLADDDDIPDMQRIEEGFGGGESGGQPDLSDQYDKAMQDLLRDMKLSTAAPAPAAAAADPFEADDEVPASSPYSGSSAQPAAQAQQAQQGYYQSSYVAPPPPQQQQPFYQPPPSMGYPQQPAYQPYGPYGGQQASQASQAQQFYDMEDDSAENIEDKLHLLDCIDDYSRMLKKIDGVQLNNIPIVNQDSSYSEIQKTHDILRQKMDRVRYTEMGEAVMLSLTKILEDSFDGKTEVLGTKLDMRGVSTRMQYKMKYFRHDLARGARYICQKVPIVQPILEILPILIIHSRDAASTLKKDNISLDYERASNEMNNF